MINRISSIVVASLFLAGCAHAVVTLTDDQDAAVAIVDAAAPDVHDAGVRPDSSTKSDAATTGAACECLKGCGSCPSVAEVVVDTYRIDATEVTNVHYATFLAAHPRSSGLPAECANHAFDPVGGWPAASGDETKPVVNVDWCDAYAYCKWEGKRLCGSISGGTNASADYANADKSQWYRACSGGGNSAYPYGSDYSANACNGADHGHGTSMPVAQQTSCVGSYSSLFDMSGNVWEWEDSCDSTTEECHIRGGSFSNAASALACDVNATLPRAASGPDVGIRCCSL